jgi:hypothetical protein
MTALGWAKNVAYIFGVLAAVLVGFGIWKYSDLLSSVNAAKQAVISTSDAARNKIENSSAQCVCPYSRAPEPTGTAERRSSWRSVKPL